MRRPYGAALLTSALDRREQGTAHPLGSSVGDSDKVIELLLDTVRADCTAASQASPLFSVSVAPVLVSGPGSRRHHLLLDLAVISRWVVSLLLLPSPIHSPETSMLQVMTHRSLETLGDRLTEFPFGMTKMFKKRYNTVNAQHCECTKCQGITL